MVSKVTTNSTAPKWRQGGRRLSALTKVTLVALVINTLAFASEFFLIGHLDREVSIVVGILLVVSGLVATGWRWTPALGALVAGGILIGNPFLVYNLSQPISNGFFLAALVEAISGIVIVVAGIGATAQNYWKHN
jgi:hypothetical protein